MPSSADQGGPTLPWDSSSSGCVLLRTLCEHLWVPSRLWTVRAAVRAVPPLQMKAAPPSSPYQSDHKPLGPRLLAGGFLPTLQGSLVLARALRCVQDLSQVPASLLSDRALTRGRAKWAVPYYGNLRVPSLVPNSSLWSSASCSRPSMNPAAGWDMSLVNPPAPYRGWEGKLVPLADRSGHSTV